MDENRRAIRRRVLKSAMIEFDHGAHSCAVRNLSEGGAALDVPYALAIPHEFTLTASRWVTQPAGSRACALEKDVGTSK